MLIVEVKIMHSKLKCIWTPGGAQVVCSPDVEIRLVIKIEVSDLRFIMIKQGCTLSLDTGTLTDSFLKCDYHRCFTLLYVVISQSDFYR